MRSFHFSIETLGNGGSTRVCRALEVKVLLKYIPEWNVFISFFIFGFWRWTKKGQKSAFPCGWKILCSQNLTGVLPMPYWVTNV